MAHTFDPISAVQNAGKSPLPAWAMSASLLYAGLSSHKPVDTKLGSGGSSHFSRTLALSKPTRASCFLFGGVNALGGYIIYDDDVTNGAGFTFAWSTLYLLVNGRSAVKSLLGGRVSPLALSVLALGNAGIYAREFFWPSAF